MEVILRKYGNSTGIAFPPGVLKDMGLKAGQALVMEPKPDGTITLSPKRRYSLAELVAQCNRKAAPPADMAVWDTIKPVGHEVL
jgi:antitoxin ChpS